MRSLRASIAVLIGILAGPPPAAGELAQVLDRPPQGAGPPGPGLQVFLMTMGPGERVEERFGHNAIWIRDTVAGTDLIYNYGMFDYDAPNFIWNFVKARGMYWLEAFDLPTTLRQYDFRQRRVEVQELALNTAQKGHLAFLLAQNALPANREYRYDYFLDNCSTRIRDILDVVLGGALRQATEGRAAEGTYRWHTQRSVSNNPWLYLGILAGQGGRVDDPLDQWGEMFLPAKVQERMRELRVVDDRGLEVPLVMREATLLEHEAFSVEPSQPDWSLRLFLIGAALALAIGTGVVRGGAGIPGRVLGGTWAVATAVGGVLLLFLWLFTNHVMSAWNANVLLFSPLALALLPLLLRRGEGSIGRRLATGHGAIVLLGSGLAFSGMAQDNHELAALMALPSLAALAVAMVVSRRRAAVPPSPT